MADARGRHYAIFAPQMADAACLMISCDITYVYRICHYGRLYLPSKRLSLEKES